MNKIMLFDGAIKRAKLMINANYKTAVPQYYKGKIQLLIPICLISENVPDLALAVSKNGAGDQYLGHTCLTLDMAYNNARLIAIKRIGTPKLCAKGWKFPKKRKKIEAALRSRKATSICFR